MQDALASANLFPSSQTCTLEVTFSAKLIVSTVMYFSICSGVRSLGDVMCGGRYEHMWSTVKFGPNPTQDDRPETECCRDGAWRAVALNAEFMMYSLTV